MATLHTLTRPLHHLPCTLPPTLRTLSTTSFLSHVGGHATAQVAGRYSAVPPYPYGARLWYKKSNFGLYGLASVRFGNNVSSRNEIKTRRRWYPNVHRKRLWSVSLGRFIRTRVTTRVLRTIDKVGGIDEYLLGEKAQRIKELGPGGWALRWRIMRTEGVRERMRGEMVRLGLMRGSGSEEADGAEGMMREISGDEGVSEGELRAREEAIDRVLDEDDARAERGEEGGVELEAPEALEEVVGEREEKGMEQAKRRKW